MRQRQARRQVLSLVRMGVQCSLAQLLVTGVMHGDPHSGNLLLRKVRLAERCCVRWRLLRQAEGIPGLQPAHPVLPLPSPPRRQMDGSATSTSAWWSV